MKIAYATSERTNEQTYHKIWTTKQQNRQTPANDDAYTYLYVTGNCGENNPAREHFDLMPSKWSGVFLRGKKLTNRRAKGVKKAKKSGPVCTMNDANQQNTEYCTRNGYTCEFPKKGGYAIIKWKLNQRLKPRRSLLYVSWLYNSFAIARCFTLRNTKNHYL